MYLPLQPEDLKGLSQKEASEILQKEGYNELPSSKPKSVFKIAFGVVKEPMFLLLVACGTLYLILEFLRIPSTPNKAFTFIVRGGNHIPDPDP